MRLPLADTPIFELRVMQRMPMDDTRGYLERMFCQHELHDALRGKGVAQINRTLTVRRGTVRGLHLQNPPHAEMKIVSCLRGEVFDVAVDLRADSPTFLRWHAEVLSEGNRRSMVIPEGFAHGFQTLTDDCELLYFHTAAYHAPSEVGLSIRDPRLAISWPEPIIELSARDASHPIIDAHFDGVRL